MELKSDLGGRERQILEILYRLGEANVAQVRKEIPNPPTYSAVRGMLTLLERKELVRHRRDGLRYVYAPTTPPASAARLALRHIIRTFFSGSPEKVVAALLNVSDTEITEDDFGRFRKILRDQRGEAS